MNAEAVRRILLVGAMIAGGSASAAPFHFFSGDPDGKMAVGARAPGPAVEIEPGDDFLVGAPVNLTQASFTGLLPIGVSPSAISEVVVEIYRVFPLDSGSPNGAVPTRANSPSDVAFAVRDSAASELTFSTVALASSFTAANSVLNGINPIPGQTTGGEGPVTGQELRLDVTFATPIALAADHYFFVPQVLVTGGSFYWLSAAKPITGAGTTPFVPDLQSWVRNANLAPNWLRVGTDIVGGAAPPTFNQSFSLDGLTPPAFDPSVPTLSPLGLAVLCGSLGAAAWMAVRRRRRTATAPERARS